MNTVIASQLNHAMTLRALLRMSLASFAICLLLVGLADAQPVILEIEGGVPIRINGDGFRAFGDQIVIRNGKIQGGDLGVDEDAGEELSGGALKTDPDLEALLDKANRHAEEGNIRVATRLWQAVLERSGDSLYTQDKINYFSISDQIEQILAKLPAEALDIYRVTADASARQILTAADDPNDIGALMRVTGNYFISSEGDDAAFRLGCIYLDRYDFSGALRLFRRIATQHPDPSVSLDEVYARMAICSAMMGDAEQASQSLVDGRGFGADSPAIDAVERSLDSLVPSDIRNTALAQQWSTVHGNSRRLAAMPSLPESAFDRDQYAAWQFFVTPKNERYSKKLETVGKVLVGDQYDAETRDSVEKMMISEWKQNDWRPAGHLLFDKERVYFKAPADFVSFDRQKVNDAIASAGGEKETESDVSDFSAWRSIWRNYFEIDPATSQYERRASSRTRIINRQQKSAAIVSQLSAVPRHLNFGDRIHQQASLQDGVIYSIEGKSFDDRNRHSTTTRNSGHWNAQFRRTRSNFMTAYEAETGRLLWRLPRVNEAGSPSFDPSEKKAVVEDNDQEWLSSGGLMAAPVAFADMLILPVNKNGAIYLYGVDPEDEGRTVWSSFLCDEPENGSVASSPINLTIDGSDLFATCGTGVLFAVDPTTGKIRFAKRYRRIGQQDQFVKPPYSPKKTAFDGWSSDTIIPNGRELICFCSDSSTIFAIDRNDGSKIWETGLRPYGLKVDYIMGAWGDLLYLGGQQTIIAIDLSAEGYIAWGGEDLFDGQTSNGRGMVTPQGVFVPVENAIWRFALKGNKKGRAEVLNQVEAFLGTDAPVGNLYSDGERIWVHGASRLYALAPKED